MLLGSSAASTRVLNGKVNLSLPFFSSSIVEVLRQNHISKVESEKFDTIFFFQQVRLSISE